MDRIVFLFAINNNNVKRNSSLDIQTKPIYSIYVYETRRGHYSSSILIVHPFTNLNLEVRALDALVVLHQEQQPDWNCSEVWEKMQP